MTVGLMTKAGCRIYVVDDDPSARSALGRLLKSAGYRVKLFASAQEFLEGGPVETDAVILLDLRMPGIGGLELQKRLRTAGEDGPIIFLTAFEDPQARIEALKKGAVAFLQKPVDEKVLFEAIRKAKARNGEPSPSNSVKDKGPID
jgi:FixJ family two-component response regulator